MPPAVPIRPASTRQNPIRGFDLIPTMILRRFAMAYRFSPLSYKKHPVLRLLRTKSLNFATALFPIISAIVGRARVMGNVFCFVYDEQKSI